MAVPVDKIKVSLLEDFPCVGHRISTMISESGEYNFIRWYKSAEETLDDIAQNLPDLIIVDLGLPGMNGLECIKH